MYVCRMGKEECRNGYHLYCHIIVRWWMWKSAPFPVFLSWNPFFALSFHPELCGPRSVIRGSGWVGAEQSRVSSVFSCKYLQQLTLIREREREQFSISPAQRINYGDSPSLKSAPPGAQLLRVARVLASGFMCVYLCVCNSITEPV